jgi:hypothetical protein
MKELEKKIVKFAEDRDWLQFNTPENLAKSISIEAGELLECFQWNNNYDKDELKYEIAVYNESGSYKQVVKGINDYFDSSFGEVYLQYRAFLHQEVSS